MHIIDEFEMELTGWLVGWLKSDRIPSLATADWDWQALRDGACSVQRYQKQQHQQQREHKLFVAEGCKAHNTPRLDLTRFDLSMIGAIPSIQLFLSFS